MQYNTYNTFHLECNTSSSAILVIKACKVVLASLALRVKLHRGFINAEQTEIRTHRILNYERNG